MVAFIYRLSTYVLALSLALSSADLALAAD
jgi:hypothetical protein